MHANTLKIVHSRRGRAADAVAEAGVCIVGRRSSTAPAATTVDGDAVAVQSTSCYMVGLIMPVSAGPTHRPISVSVSDRPI